MTRSTASRRARNSDSVMIGGRRRPVSRPSRRRCRLASSRVEPLTARTSSVVAAARPLRLADVHDRVRRVVGGADVAVGRAAAAAAPAPAPRRLDAGSRLACRRRRRRSLLGARRRRPMAAAGLARPARLRLAAAVRGARRPGPLTCAARRSVRWPPRTARPPDPGRRGRWPPRPAARRRLAVAGAAAAAAAGAAGRAGSPPGRRGFVGRPRSALGRHARGPRPAAAAGRPLGQVRRLEYHDRRLERRRGCAGPRPRPCLAAGTAATPVKSGPRPARRGAPAPAAPRLGAAARGGRLAAAGRAGCLGRGLGRPSCAGGPAGRVAARRLRRDRLRPGRLTRRRGQRHAGPQPSGLVRLAAR